METPSPQQSQLASARRRLRFRFRRRGVVIAFFAGANEGNYAAFMTLGMSVGAWTLIRGDEFGLSPFACAFMLCALGAALADAFGALWALAALAPRGKLGDFFRCLPTRPGFLLSCGAVAGGPIACTAYAVGLQQAGALAVPVSALYPAIGAILARIFLRQPLTARMGAGIAVCMAASFIVGLSGMTAEERPGMALGLAAAFVAGLGWGVEGCVGGYASAIIDQEIGIAMRETVNALLNLFVFVPVLAFMGGADLLPVLGAVLTDPKSLLCFLVAGFACYLTYMFWYKGNAMCGTALGMACSGVHAFCGPFWCWFWLGLVFGQEGWTLSPALLAGALLMVAGIVIIAMNPLDLFRRRNAPSPGT